MSCCNVVKAWHVTAARMPVCYEQQHCCCQSPLLVDVHHYSCGTNNCTHACQLLTPQPLCFAPPPPLPSLRPHLLSQRQDLQCPAVPGGCGSWCVHHAHSSHHLQRPPIMPMTNPLASPCTPTPNHPSPHTSRPHQQREDLQRPAVPGGCGSWRVLRPAEIAGHGGVRDPEPQRRLLQPGK
jgi:hypothetical protein